MSSVKEQIQSTVKQLFGVDLDIELTRPEPQFGDFSTNAALQLSKQLGRSPREIAQDIADALKNNLEDSVDSIEIAGPGFINLKLKDALLIAQLRDTTKLPKALQGKVVVAEYSDPNPFKILHAGHLYTSVVGDAIANLLEVQGAVVHRVNFGGDVGLHVGKTMWAIIRSLGGELPERLSEYKSTEQRTGWLAQCYITGTNAYEDDEGAKAEIVELNKRVYQLHAANDKSSAFAQIYWTTRQWSYDYFDSFYERIGTKFEKYYPESEVAQLGLDTVKQHMKAGIFEESDGAVVFKGEPHGLHTRVFINKEGLPTYEAKDVGLIFAKKKEFNFDQSVVITGNEQEQYMAVVLKAIEQFAPEVVQATNHLTHGLVKLQGGVKMSSRKGNILRAVDVLDAAAAANQQATGKEDSSVTLGAVKYAFLKVRTGGDIVYDPQESVSLDGNSGPYLQYAHARARSILKKSEKQPGTITSLDENERALARKLTEYSETIVRASESLMPHLVCTYLYELAVVFNRFYEASRVIGDPREEERLRLIAEYADTLKSGLTILGITAPESM